MSQTAVLSISVDSHLGGPRRRASPAVFEPVLVELLDRFNKRRIPATWAFPDPSAAPIVPRLLSAPLGHEVAVLLDSGHPDLSRGGLVETAIAPIQAAARRGAVVTTLAANGTWRPQHVNLLAKHGISIIRGRSNTQLSARLISRHGSRGIQTLCHGIWHVPVTAELNGGGWFANSTQLFRVRRSIQRTAVRGGVGQVCIDLATFAQGDIPSGLRTIERFLRYVDGLRESGRILVMTLRDTALALQPHRRAAAASILRAA